MYSLVLMAALTAGVDAPSWGRGCCGCHGCWGCCGCHGCCGCYGCHGCCGCYGCYGCCGCWGCCGCYGCCGCCGSYGCCGCYGCYGCYGCCGCYGCYGCCGGYAVPGYAVPAGAAPAGGGEMVPAPNKDTGKEKDKGGSARLIIEVPAEAKLFVDDQPMKTAAERRTFSTPVLKPGQAYFYDVRAELVVDGKSYSETKRVIVKAGEVSRASFADLAKAANAPKAVAAASR